MRTTDEPARHDAAQERAERTERDTSYHPAFDRPTAPPLPAGKALLIIVIALLFGLVFNSAGVLHLALGMKPGPARSVTLSVVRPVNSLAHAVWLDRPKVALDRVFGHESDASGGAGLADGDNSILDRADQSDQAEKSGASATGPGTTEPAIVSPTVADPLRVLVLGDSLSTFVGQQLDEMAGARKLLKVRPIFKDGTGINTPEFFNWKAAAINEARKSRAQTVVFVMGGNDAQSMTHDGTTVEPRTDEWETEYARRVAVIMRALIDEGVQRVYWSGPPSARSNNWNASYRRVNAAIDRAAAAIPGTKYVDLFHADGGREEYSDYGLVDGKRIRVRQDDGIHWTYDGSRAPTELIVQALQADYGNLL